MFVFEGLESRTLLSAVPRFDHIVILMEENHSAASIYGNAGAPYLNSLAAGGAEFTQSFGVMHPSEPNYLALFSGSTQGVSDDGTYTFSGANLDTELGAAGLSFKGFAESPSVRKHDPWESFTNSAGDGAEFSQFPADFSNLPTVSFVIPNVEDDMHDGTVAAGDAWAKANIDAYAQWAKTHNSLLIVQWDEDDGSASNNIPTIFYGANVKAGSYSETINDYNILRTIENSLQLSPLGNSANASAITDVFTSSVQPPAPQPPVLPPPVTPPPAAQPPASSSSLTISKFQVNDGNAQRSMVDSVTVVFSEAVALGSNAITLNMLSQTGGTAEPMSFSASSPDGGTSWVLKFTGAGYVGGSLPDGAYSVNVTASAVTHAAGNSLSGGNQSFTFIRLFGDINGDGVVDINDLAIFGFTFGTTTTASDWYMDFNGDGIINATDFSMFGNNWAKTMSIPAAVSVASDLESAGAMGTPMGTSGGSDADARILG